ncbi:uncharacterized protein FOBCDRAFT_276772 [Fusarium oxysporum Fo47]|uniref:EthD domain-containing protein n=1 Tax=Fusarium oxysporum Fo47 TaxID=660027 RepID=W9J9U5_FUSOX|nr:uncharacterized protein FOBCDRAFT_276772 [Fusarium oxysporum Fo47]EWZ28641.1 hypothetical protein FOZG_17646 [Fusarium oxysporum Fo47]QKD57153.1 hypothetical protein FOBCDRAFT_276772 [Fusarium oxysporum Fo47]
MTVTLTALYPQDADFDFDYYIQTHLPLAENIAGSLLVDWHVMKVTGDTPYCVQATLVWSSAEELEGLMASDAGAKLIEDVKNFSGKPPLLLQQCSEIASRRSMQQRGNQL